LVPLCHLYSHTLPPHGVRLHIVQGAVRLNIFRFVRAIQTRSTTQSGRAGRSVRDQKSSVQSASRQFTSRPPTKEQVPHGHMIQSDAAGKFVFGADLTSSTRRTVCTTRLVSSRSERHSGNLHPAATNCLRQRSKLCEEPRFMKLFPLDNLGSTSLYYP